MKWDGVRAVVLRRRRTRPRHTRNDLDVTATYPELRELGRALGSTEVVLDGELVALDAAGRPELRRLQPRMHVKGRGAGAPAGEVASR